MSRYDDDYQDEIDDEYDDGIDYLNDRDEDEDEAHDESPRSTSGSSSGKVNPFSSARPPSGGPGTPNRFGDSSRLPNASPGGAGLNRSASGGPTPPPAPRAPLSGSGMSRPSSAGGSSSFSRPPAPGSPASAPPARPGGFSQAPPGGGSSPRPFGKPDDRLSDRASSPSGGSGSLNRPSPFGKPDDRSGDRGSDRPATPIGSGGSRQSPSPFGKPDDRPATPMGTSRGATSSAFGAKPNRDDEKEEKSGGFLGGLRRGDKGDDKKDEKVSGSGSGFGSKLPSFGSRAGDKPDAKKSDDKASGGGLGGKLGGMVPKFGGDRNDKPDRPATPKNASAAKESKGGGLFGGLRRGGDKDDKPVFGSGGSARSGASSGSSGAAFGSSSRSTGTFGAAPATPKSAAPKTPRPSIKERIRSFSLFKKPDAKTARARASKAPTVRSARLSLDTRLDILGVFLVLSSLGLIFSSLSPTQGQITGSINSFLAQTFGWGAIAVPIAMFGIGIWLILRHFGDDAPVLDTMRVIGLLVLYIGMLVLFQYVDSFNYRVSGPDYLTQLRDIYLFISYQTGQGGGWIGAEIYYFLVSQLTEIGGFFVLLAWLLVGFMLTLSLSAAEMAIIVISVGRSFNDARKRRVQARAVREAERAAAAAQLPAIGIARPTPEPLPAGAGSTSPALPAPALDASMEERSIPITKGGRTVTASFRPADAVPVESASATVQSPLQSPLEPVRQGAGPFSGGMAVTAPGDKAEGSSGGFRSRFGGMVGRVRESLPAPGKPEGDAAKLTPETATTAGDNGHAPGRFGGFAARVRDAIPGAKPTDKSTDKSTDKPVAASDESPVPSSGDRVERPQSAAKPPSPAESFAPPAASAPASPFGGLSLDDTDGDDGADGPAAVPVIDTPSVQPSTSTREPIKPRGYQRPAFRSEDERAGEDDGKDAEDEGKSGNRPVRFGTLLGSAPPSRPLAGKTSTRPEKEPTGDEASAASGDTDTVEPTLPTTLSPAASVTPRPVAGPANRPLSGPPAPAAPVRGDGDSPASDDRNGDRNPDKNSDKNEKVAEAANDWRSRFARPAGTARPPAPPLRGPVPPPVAGSAKADDADSNEPQDRAQDEADDLINLAPAKPKGIGPLPRPVVSPFGKPNPAIPSADRKPATTLQERMAAMRGDKPQPTDEDAETTGQATAPAEAQETPTQEAAPVDNQTTVTAASPVPDETADATPPAAEAPSGPALAPAAARKSDPPWLSKVLGKAADTGSDTHKNAGEETDAAEALPTLTQPRNLGIKPPPVEKTEKAAANAGKPPAFTMPEGPTPPPPPARSAFTAPAAPSGAPQSSPPTSKSRREWTLPVHADLLAQGADPEIKHDVLLERARMIEETLSSFGAPGRVVEVRTGPVITQFGVEPDYLPGRGGKKIRVKVSSIAQLDKDLQLALGAKSIRIEAPVPGKGYVGIEVPNAQPAVVRLRDVLDAQEFRRINSPLAIALGQGVDGTPVAADLASMPHLLIAGTTGSGKSVCVNTIICSLLIRNGPDRLKFIMVDPKRVELTGYNGIPHLVAPVVVELERIVSVLKWVTREMDERYKKFASAGARNIEDFNKHLPQGEALMPYIVVIIDELADLMMLAPDETERVITRIAALARATGIHLVIATQRPSVDVVTGLIKANFPARIAFAVASMMDSRVIMDQPGAERLLGRGDMLYMSGDSPAPARLQGVYLSDAEINNITRFWREQAATGDQTDARPAISQFALDEGEVPNTATGSWAGDLNRGGEKRPAQQQVAFWDRELSDSANNLDSGDGGNDDDELYEEAVEMVRRLQKASVSLLQRRLRIGYGRAARLIDMMEERGVVGPPVEGSKPRDVLEKPPGA